MRTLLFATLALLTLAPLAAAQDETREEPRRPEDAAWVEDCPPDMMCAYSGGSKAPDEEGGDGRVYKDEEPQPYGPEDCIECSGPAPEGEGGAEPGQAIGPEDCIDCMRPAPGDAGTCMDGAQENETCDARGDCVASASSADACGDVQYMVPPGDEPTRGPADGSCENCRGDAVEDAEPISAPVTGAEQKAETDAAGANDVPTAGLGIIVAAFGLAVVLVARKL